MIRTLALAVLAAPLPAAAYVSSEGHEYLASCPEDAVVLQSAYPITRILENGANTKHVKGTETITLSADCSAHTDVFGYGTWAWANGGFWISFPAYAIQFPRQELYCAEEPPVVDGRCGG